MNNPDTLVPYWYFDCINSAMPPRGILLFVIYHFEVQAKLADIFVKFLKTFFIKISLKFISKGQVDKMSALLQVRAWHLLAPSHYLYWWWPSCNELCWILGEMIVFPCPDSHGWGLCLIDRGHPGVVCQGLTGSAEVIVGDLCMETSGPWRTW